MSQADEKPDSTEAEAPAPDEETEGEEEEEAPPISRGQAIFRFAVVTLALFAIIDIGARVAFWYHHRSIHAAAAADYPPGAYIGNFSAVVDYRFINFYTADPARANNEVYDFDANGFRLDKRKLRFDAPIPFKKIWLLGGSTVQGLGALADETIPANLNDLLEKNQSQYRAINMGQGAYTSTQELLLLIELLQSGQRPDVIISYDGGTEVPFAGDAAKTGTPEWEKHTTKTRLLFDVQSDESFSTLFAFTLSRMTRIDDVMLSITRRLSAGGAAPAPANWDVVAQRYLATLNLIKAAADQQKAPSLFFFQPLLQYEDHYKIRKLSEHEEKLKPTMAADEYKRRDAIHSDAVAELRKNLGESFSDIHDVFRGHDGENLYADARHPNGAGNALIAARIYDEFKKIDAATK